MVKTLMALTTSRVYRSILIFCVIEFSIKQMAIFQFILSHIKVKMRYLLAAMLLWGFIGTAQAQELPADADPTIRETLAAAHDGDVESMYTIAVYLLEQGQIDKPDYLPLAFGWTLNAARRGHPQSAELAGVMYRRGIGTARNFVKARKWLDRALARGSNEPNFELALLYSEDENPGASKQRAASYLNEAIQKKEPRACLISARNKINGGIELRKAIDEIRCAAEGGIVDAMIMMADYHLTKRSPYAKANAREWLLRASDLGSAEAMNKLASLGD